MNAHVAVWQLSCSDVADNIYDAVIFIPEYRAKI